LYSLLLVLVGLLIQHHLPIGSTDLPNLLNKLRVLPRPQCRCYYLHWNLLCWDFVQLVRLQLEVVWSLGSMILVSCFWYENLLYAQICYIFCRLHLSNHVWVFYLIRVAWFYIFACGWVRSFWTIFTSAIDRFFCVWSL
jgi:hypothetical protein